jgi:hypothetical protein
MPDDFTKRGSADRFVLSDALQWNWPLSLLFVLSVSW